MARVTEIIGVMRRASSIHISSDLPYGVAQYKTLSVDSA